MTLPPPALLIDRIAAGAFVLPESGATFACPVRSVAIAPTLDGREEALVRAIGLTGRLAVISDENTHDVLGRRLARALGRLDDIVLRQPKADEATAAELEERSRFAAALIAVGAGTLNDLCKYVGHRTGRATAVFATAPSMNGYATATASITRDGRKLSLPAAAPRGVFFDLAVQAAAPVRMIRAGIGDSLCRTTAQVDWLLAHLLLDQPYLATPFALQAEAERQLLDRAGAAVQGDGAAIRSLVELLVLGGFGMLIAGSSAPASQGEHLISHYIDSFARPHPGGLHGEQIAVTTWTMAQLQSSLLDRSAPPRLQRVQVDPAAMVKRYGLLAGSFQSALAKKTQDGTALNQHLAQGWPQLRAALSKVQLPLDQLRAAFQAAAIPTAPEAIGIEPAFYRCAVRHARELRERYTMLDFAADADLLDEFVDRAA